MAKTKTRYVVVIDGEPGAFGLWVPDMPGCTSMGENVDGLDSRGPLCRDFCLARGYSAQVARSAVAQLKIIRVISLRPAKKGEQRRYAKEET
jgi:hypothetical protein